MSSYELGVVFRSNNPGARQSHIEHADNRSTGIRARIIDVRSHPRHYILDRRRGGAGTRGAPDT